MEWREEGEVNLCRLTLDIKKGENELHRSSEHNTLV